MKITKRPAKNGMEASCMVGGCHDESSVTVLEIYPNPQSGFQFRFCTKHWDEFENKMEELKGAQDGSEKT